MPGVREDPFEQAGVRLGRGQAAGERPVGVVLGHQPAVARLHGGVVRLPVEAEDAVNEGNTSWSATAGLTLKTDADVAPGAYASVLTISLFEDIG